MYQIQKYNEVVKGFEEIIFSLNNFISTFKSKTADNAICADIKGHIELRCKIYLLES